MFRLTRVIIEFIIFCILFQLSSARQPKLNDNIFECFTNGRLQQANLLHPPQTAWESLKSSRFHFAVDLIQGVVRFYDSPKNLFFSPHSIYRALLTILLSLSNGYVKNNLKTVLRLPQHMDKLEMLQMFKMESEFDRMRSSVMNNVSYQLIEANKIFYQNTLAIRECTKSIFKDELYEMDFGRDPLHAQRFINTWVSNRTNYQINDFLDNVHVDEQTKLILVNALYFKGLWQSKFQLEETSQQVFYVSRSKSVLVPMMRQTGNFRYMLSEKLNVHVIELPYKGDDIAMLILLPPVYDSVAIEVVLNQLTVDDIAEMVDSDSLLERQIELAIPKFTCEHTLDDLAQILTSMGIGGGLFRPYSTQGVVAAPDVDALFNEVVHKAKISVDEEGAEASAATAFVSFRSARPLDSVKFICDHPFVYFLYDRLTQSMLFIGVYNSPI